MKAAIVHAAGQTPVFGDFDEPTPGAGEALVSVSAAALSHITRSRASGAHYSSSGRFPFVAGVDGVGRLADGARVYFLMPRAPYGAMAEQAVVAAANCLPLPDDLDDATAAAIAIPGLSSWAALRERAKLKAGETVLVNGATGASGRLAVRIARHLGAKKVLATGRNERVLASLEADAIIPLSNGAEMDEAFNRAFSDGVDVVLDYLWGRSAERLLICAARHGADGVPIRFVQIGSISASDITLPSAVLRSSAIEMMGSGVGGVPFPRLVEAIRGLLQAAVPSGFAIATKQAPLSAVAQHWQDDGGAARAVFMI